MQAASLHAVAMSVGVRPDGEAARRALHDAVPRGPHDAPIQAQAPNTELLPTREPTPPILPPDPHHRTRGLRQTSVDQHRQALARAPGARGDDLEQVSQQHRAQGRVEVAEAGEGLGG